MSYITDHKRKFDDLHFQIKNRDQLRRQANGGNSILFSYPPNEENLYIEKARELYREKATFIDVSQLLVRLIDDDGWESFRDYFLDFRNTPHLIFRSDDPTVDLFDLIISKIEAASKSGNIPFLIRTGCLYGTGIENVNIMEDRAIMTLPHVLVFFYPSRLEDENLYFMNFKPASKYRCKLIN